ncbi:LysR family transcriptional regulator [Colwellia sp. MEBiC06753]
MLNPVWLKTFVTLIDMEHFTKAAEKLFMTQPGVSQHINKLEQACGHLLIHRENKRFELTEQGRMVYQYAQQLAKNEQQLLENMTFDNPYQGHYQIACSGSLALILYPKLLDLQLQHPQLVPKLKAAPNQQILTEIQSGLVDIGIVTHVPNPKIFDVQVLTQEQLCLVLPKGIDAERDCRACMQQLGLIDHPDAQHYLSLYFSLSQDENFDGMQPSDFPVSGFVNQISQILQPVALGLGFTVLPKSAVDSFYASEQLTIYQPHKPVFESLYLVKKRNRELPARFETVISALRQWL